MSDFADNHITRLGEALLAGVMAGGTITFTRIVMGDGMMPEIQTPATMTDVISPKAEASITKCARGDNGTAVVGARFTNESQEEDFVWRELGLYAKGADESEVLYSYGYTPAGELIPASGETVIEKLVDIVTYIGDRAEVTAIFDPSFIPQMERIEEADVDAAWESGAHDPSTGKGLEFLDRPGLTELVSKVKRALEDAAPKISADGATIEITPEGVVSVKAGGVGTAQLADGSVTKKKLATGAVDGEALGPSSVTSENIVDGTIQSIDLADKIVTEQKLGDISVSSAKLADGAVTAPKLAADIKPLSDEAFIAYITG